MSLTTRVLSLDVNQYLEKYSFYRAEEVIDKAIHFFDNPKGDVGYYYGNKVYWKIRDKKELPDVFMTLFSEKHPEHSDQVKMLKSIAHIIDIDILPQFLDKWGIKDHQNLIEFADIAAFSMFRKYDFNSDSDISKLLNNYNLVQENDRIQIAKMLAEEFPKKLSKHIKTLRITNQAALIEIAFIAVENEKNEISKWIHLFGISDQKALFKIALAAAETDVWNFLSCFKNFGIKKESDRIELVKYFVRYCPYAYMDLNNFNIQIQNGLIEIAKIIAEQMHWGISKIINTYGITDQNALFEIAEIAAKNSRDDISKYIKTYSIEDCDKLVKVAKIAAENGQISEFINNYGIKDQSTLISIAEIAAANSIDDTSKHIKNYGIENHDALVKIAKIAAEHKGDKASKDIQNYGIINTDILLKIAKIAASNGGRISYEYRENYGIEDQEILIELAMISAKHPNGMISRDIKGFGIRSKKALIKIAKNAAENNGYQVSCHIKKYGIKDKEALIHIAKISAANDGSMIAHIENYAIDNVKELFLITKIAAANNGLETSKAIRQNPIRCIFNQSELFEIAKIAARQNGFGTSYYFDRYGLENVYHRLIIFCLAASQSREAEKYISNYNISLNWPFVDTNHLSDSATSDLKTIFEKVSENQTDKIKEQSHRWLAIAVSAIGLQNTQILNLLLEKGTIKTILLARSPRLRYKILSNILEFSSTNVNWYTTYLSFFLKYKIIPKHMLIPLLYLSQFEETFAHDLFKKIKGKQFRSLLRDCNVYKSLYHTLYKIYYEQKNLDLDDKKHLLSLLFQSDKDFKTVLSSIQTILALGHASLLKRDLIPDRNEINRQFKNAFEIEFDEFNIENFTEKYHATLGRFRDETAVMRYLGSLKQLPMYERAVCLEAYKKFISAVLNNEFSSLRSNGSHLETIFTSDPKIKELWMTNVEQPFISQIDTGKSIAIDFYEFLKNNLIEHAEKSRFPLLRSYLYEKDFSEKREIERRSKKLKTRFQFLAIQLLKASDNLINCHQILQRLLPLIPQETNLAEFKNSFFNLNSQISDYLNANLNKSIFQGWTVNFTDNPCDLLLSGTELESCQKIDGTPANNKCLLAYLLDGKNKLVAIKNKWGELQARAYLRICWDKFNKSPVLFMERIYPEMLSDEKKEALIHMANEIAKTLTIPLLSSSFGNGKPYNTPIHSLGSPAPYEYVDALGGIQYQGVYSIRDTHEI